MALAVVRLPPSYFLTTTFIIQFQYGADMQIQMSCQTAMMPNPEARLHVHIPCTPENHERGRLVGEDEDVHGGACCYHGCKRPADPLHRRILNEQRVSIAVSALALATRKWTRNTKMAMPRADADGSHAKHGIKDRAQKREMSQSSSFTALMMPPIPRATPRRRIVSQATALIAFSLRTPTPQEEEDAHHDGHPGGVNAVERLGDPQNDRTGEEEERPPPLPHFAHGPILSSIGDASGISDDLLLRRQDELNENEGAYCKDQTRDDLPGKPYGE